MRVNSKLPTKGKRFCQTFDHSRDEEIPRQLDHVGSVSFLAGDESLLSNRVEKWPAAPEDTANFTLLLSEFRRQLDEQGRKDDVHYQLTMAGSAWVDDYSKYEWPKIHPLLDFINVMTYGLAPPGKTRPHSPLYQSSTETGKWSSTFNTDYAVKRYLAEGVPANKIIMGVPFYAMGWEAVPDVNNGLYQKPGSEPLAAPYTKLKNLKGFRLFRDTETRALWIFNPQTGVFWSFDDPDSLSVKMDYVRRMQLGGVMFWELSGDDENSSLLKAIYRGLRQ